MFNFYSPLTLTLFLCQRKQRKRSISQRPPPAPKPQPRPQGPRCRALHQYNGQDVDEISFDVNDVFDLIKEGTWVKVWKLEQMFPRLAVKQCMTVLSSLLLFSPSRSIWLVDWKDSRQGGFVPWKLCGKDLNRLLSIPDCLSIEKYFEWEVGLHCKNRG